MPDQSIICSRCSCRIDLGAWDPTSATLSCPECRLTVPILDEETDLPELGEVRGVSLAEVDVPGFELLNEVGRGAMGVVFRARQLSLDRTVAIKVLAPELARDQGFEARFDREAEVLSRLDHPHIVSIVDRGQADGVSFIVMEFVAGPGGQSAQTLRDLINSGHVGVDRTRNLIMQVADALQCAHEAGVVHRDLKPGNILVDTRGNARVVDFGIATVSGRSTDAELTTAGKPIGTPDYMSPEQWRDGRSVDARSDIFSLGVILYEMFTGQLPVGAFRPASEHLAGLPTRWDHIITRALQPEPERRFPTMTALLEELSSVDAVEPTPVPASKSISCPACSETISLDSGTCQNCGLETGKAIVHHRNRVIGEQHLATVVEDTSLEDQLWMGEQALSAFREAEEACPNVEIFKLVRDSRQRVASLALVAAREFIENKNYAEASGLLHRADENQSSDEVTKLLRRIEKTRAKALAEVQQRLRDGEVTDAVELLKLAEKHFRGDVEITGLLNRHRSVAEQVTVSVEDQIPELIKQRRLHAVLNLIRQLGERGAHVPELGRLSERITARLERLRTAVECARRAADQGEYDTAIELCGKILARCADHEEAQGIRVWATQRRVWIAQVKRGVETSVDSNRWYEASYLLEALTDQELSTDWFASAKKTIVTAIDRLSAHSHLIIFSVFGCVVFLMSAVLVAPIRDSLFVPVLGVVADLSPGFADWLRPIAPVLIHFSLTALGTSLVMSLAISARPRALLATLGIAAVFGTVIGSIDAAFQSEWLLPAAENVAEYQSLYSLGKWFGSQSGLIAYGVAIALFVAMNWSGLVESSRRQRLVLSACWVGAVVAIVLNRLPSDEYLISPHLAAGLTATGCVMVFGVRCNLGRVMLLPMVSVLTGVVTASLSRSADAWPFAFVSQANAIVLALSATVVFPYRGPGRLLATAVLTWIAVTLSWQAGMVTVPLELGNLMVAFALWFAICGTVAREQSEHLDTSWHMVERVRVVCQRLNSRVAGRVNAV